MSILDQTISMFSSCLAPRIKRSRMKIWLINLSLISIKENLLFSVIPRSHIHGSPRRFHYGSNPTDDPGYDNFRSPMQMHYASTTTYDYGCNTEIYGLIRIATDDAGSYPWLILRGDP